MKSTLRLNIRTISSVSGDVDPRETTQWGSFWLALCVETLRQVCGFKVCSCFNMGHDQENFLRQCERQVGSEHRVHWSTTNTETSPRWVFFSASTKRTNPQCSIRRDSNQAENHLFKYQNSSSHFSFTWAETSRHVSFLLVPLLFFPANSSSSVVTIRLDHVWWRADAQVKFTVWGLIISSSSEVNAVLCGKLSKKRFENRNPEQLV